MHWPWFGTGAGMVVSQEFMVRRGSNVTHAGSCQDGQQVLSHSDRNSSFRQKTSSPSLLGSGQANPEWATWPQEGRPVESVASSR